MENIDNSKTLYALAENDDGTITFTIFSESGGASIDLSKENAMQLAELITHYVQL